MHKKINSHGILVSAVPKLVGVVSFNIAYHSHNKEDYFMRYDFLFVLIIFITGCQGVPVNIPAEVQFMPEDKIVRVLIPYHNRYKNLTLDGIIVPFTPSAANNWIHMLPGRHIIKGRMRWKKPRIRIVAFSKEAVGNNDHNRDDDSVYLPRSNYPINAEALEKIITNPKVKIEHVEVNGEGITREFLQIKIKTPAGEIVPILFGYFYPYTWDDICIEFDTISGKTYRFHDLLHERFREKSRLCNRP